MAAMSSRKNTQPKTTPYVPPSPAFVKIMITIDGVTRPFMAQLPDYGKRTNEELKAALRDRNAYHSKYRNKEQLVSALRQDDTDYLAQDIERTKHARAVGATHNAEAEIAFFDKLPPEIPNQVYEYAIGQPDRYYNRVGTGLYLDRSGMNSMKTSQKTPPHREPTVLRVCKMMRAEALPIYYSNQQFTFKSVVHTQSYGVPLDPWLRRLSIFALPHIRRLTIIWSGKIKHNCPKHGRMVRKDVAWMQAKELDTTFTFNLLDNQYGLAIQSRAVCSEGCGIDDLKDDMIQHFDEVLTRLRSGMPGRSLRMSKPSLMFVQR